MLPKNVFTDFEMPLLLDGSLEIRTVFLFPDWVDEGLMNSFLVNRLTSSAIEQMEQFHEDEIRQGVGASVDVFYFIKGQLNRRCAVFSTDSWFDEEEDWNEQEDFDSQFCNKVAIECALPCSSNEHFEQLPYDFAIRPETMLSPSHPNYQQPTGKEVKMLIKEVLCMSQVDAARELGVTYNARQSTTVSNWCVSGDEKSKIPPVCWRYLLSMAYLFDSRKQINITSLDFPDHEWRSLDEKSE